MEVEIVVNRVSFQGYLSDIFETGAMNDDQSHMMAIEEHFPLCHEDPSGQTMSLIRVPSCSKYEDNTLVMRYIGEQYSKLRVVDT